MRKNTVEDNLSQNEFVSALNLTRDASFELENVLAVGELQTAQNTMHRVQLRFKKQFITVTKLITKQGDLDAKGELFFIEGFCGNQIGSIQTRRMRQFVGKHSQLGSDTLVGRLINSHIVHGIEKGQTFVFESK